MTFPKCSRLLKPFLTLFRIEAVRMSPYYSSFVKNLNVTNDCAERNIGLIQQFVGSSINEDQRQNILLGTRENRKLISKNVSVQELAKLK